MVYIDIFIGVLVVANLIAAAVWDAKMRIIPDSVSLILLALGAGAFFVPPDSFWYTPFPMRLVGLALPAGTMLLLYLLGNPVGGGDLKLSASLGFLLGLPRFTTAYLIGGATALIWAKLYKQKSVPLAVFLLIGVMGCLIL